ncbi:MAG: metabolite traffic protein EboE [Cyclobacteriaceae bacterium]
MLVFDNQTHLTYCSNIHPGESWEATFSNLKEYTTQIKDGLEAEKFGIGLRLSNEASLDILNGRALEDFKNWLEEANMYVFTINGFPYGGFHHQVVKDEVHTPDWTTADRLDYTKRLFDILAELLPLGLHGGVSTSPLSYRFWHKDDEALEAAKLRSTLHLSELVIYLSELKKRTGKSLHLDMEPEPDGILETTKEFVNFYNGYMLDIGTEHIIANSDLDSIEAESAIREHFQLCYDVCHFAVGFEEPAEAINRILAQGIKIGRIQISAALGSGTVETADQYDTAKKQLKRFDEPVYLHQAVVKTKNDNLERFKDLGPGLEAFSFPKDQEIRTHFHVPIFTKTYQGLISTQQDIVDTLKAWKNKKFADHLEVETYTWDVLPENMRTDIVSSVVRELDWVRNTIGENE